MEVNEEHRIETERKILKAIINALEEGRVTDAELPDIADFVLAKIDQITNHEELIKFLGELSKKWPFFEGLEQIEKGEVTEAKEDQVEQEVLKLAKSGKVDEAISLAKTVTEK